MRRSIAVKPLVTRRHPLAIATYLLTFAFGLLFLTDVLATAAVFDPLAHVWRLAWEWELTLGGACAALALYLGPRVSKWPALADVLRLEAVGALLSGVGLLTYGVVLLSIFGWSSYTWALMLILGTGCLYRGLQAILESSRVERQGRVRDIALSVIEQMAEQREHTQTEYDEQEDAADAAQADAPDTEEQ